MVAICKFLKLNILTKVLPSLVALASVGVAYYSLKSNSVENQISLQLQSQFNKNLIDDYWEIYKGTKQKVAELVSYRNSDSIAKQLNDINGKYTTLIYSTNDTNIINCYSEIRHWIKIYYVLNRVYEISCELGVDKRPIAIIEENGKQRDVRKITADERPILIKELHKLSSVYRSDAYYLSHIYDSTLKNMYDAISVTINIHENNIDISSEELLRVIFFFLNSQESIRRQCTSSIEDLTTVFSDASQKIIKGTFENNTN